MAGNLNRRGLDLIGFVLELRGMCIVLGYPHGVDYQGKKLPEQDGDDAEPRAAWEVTAVIFTGSPEKTSLAVTAGGDSFPAACQNAALLAIGTLHQRYPDELEHSPYRYHPRRGGARDYATFRDASWRMTLPSCTWRAWWRRKTRPVSTSIIWCAVGWSRTT
jgi:hypothetical protein